VRKLFRLVQLEEIAERITQEGLVPGARDERDPVHLDALLLQVVTAASMSSTRIAKWFAPRGWVSDSIR
jgi:hypothetical protein